MSVRIGQKYRRGVAGDKSTSMDGYINIDVTSGSRNLLGDRKIAANTLSPMKLGPVVDEQGNEALVFENFWQGGKMWPTAGHIKDGTESEPTANWFRFRAKVYAMQKGKRRPLPFRQYGCATASRYNGRAYSYVDSRKHIYTRYYYQLIKHLPAIKEMQKMVADGKRLMIIDGDGAPRSLYPHGLVLTEESWNQMINDPRHPFGHGYVVAAAVAGLPERVILGKSAQGGQPSAKRGLKRTLEQDHKRASKK